MIIGSNSKVLTLLSPLNGGNVDTVHVSELGDRAGLGVPDVDERSQRNSQLILSRPVKQVEVVVIEDIRSVKNALRVLGNVTGGLLLNLGGRGDVLGVEDTKAVLVGLGLGSLGLESENLVIRRGAAQRAGQGVLEELLGGGGDSSVGLVLLGKVEMAPLEVHVATVGNEAIAAKRTSWRGDAVLVHLWIVCVRVKLRNFEGVWGKVDETVGEK
jgi:hypothetical protein